MLEVGGEGEFEGRLFFYLVGVGKAEKKDSFDVRQVD